MTDEDRIRDVYRSYEAGRDRLWDLGNPGFARLIHDRDARIGELVRRSLPAGGAVLDVGCGDGSHLGAIARSQPDARLSGLDLLPDRIEEARRSVPTGRFVVGSADALPFDPDAFDVVLAITLASSLPTEEMETAAAREVGRVLRPRGWLIWFDLRYDNPSNPAVHGIDRRRLARLFPGWTQEIRSCTVLPPLARRLGPATPVLYPLLEAIPPLRSHLIGRLRCPT